jgi:AraC-like DNA-binding protein
MTFLLFESRMSSSRFVERVWRCRSTAGGTFQSMAEANIELVVTRLLGATRVTMRGPVTVGASIACPANGDWFAIRLSPGTYLPHVPTPWLLDHKDLELPVISGERFLFEGTAWEIPTWDNAETFIARLDRAGLIARDDVVQGAVAGDRQVLTLRSVQRRFLRTVGMTHSRYGQIERARYAVELLSEGSSIQDAVFEAGYFDQAHLTRSLRKLIGRTPSAISRGSSQLSFSYKTRPAILDTD